MVIRPLLQNEFIQLHYIGWPDFNAPTDPEPITNLVKEIRKMIALSKKLDKINILVHCSAGVGRTGTLISLYKMMEKLDSLLEKHEEENGNLSDISIDIFNSVFELRSKRMNMVSKAQMLMGIIYSKSFSNIHGENYNNDFSFLKT